MSTTLIQPYSAYAPTLPDLARLERMPDVRRRGKDSARRSWPMLPARQGKPVAEVAPAPAPAAAPATPLTFETAIVPHLSAARRLARSLTRDPTAADDVLQEACLRAWRHLPSLQGDHARPWLMRIVRNAAFDQMRGRRVEVEAPIDDAGDIYLDFPDPGLGPEQTLVTNEASQLLATAIERLPRHLRECLELRVTSHLSYKDIATTLAIPLGTVMSRLHRARRHLIAAAS